MLHGAWTRGETMRGRGWRVALAAAASVAAFAAVCAAADSGIYVVSATFNGAPTASVTLGSAVEVGVTVRIVGSEGTVSWWCSTWYALECAEAGVCIEGCVPEPSPEGGCYCNWGCLTASWSWDALFTARFTIPAPSVAGSYDVTLCASSAEGTCDDETCSAVIKFTDAITATCGPSDSLTVDLGAPRALTCSSPTATLTAALTGGTAPFTYQWTPGAATTQSVTVSTAGTYFVKVTGANGCSATDTVVVTSDIAPPTVDAGNPEVLWCGAPSVVLEATVTGGTAPYSFLWTPGDHTTQSLSVTAAGTYTVTATGANGCAASDAVVVTAAEPLAEVLRNGVFEEGLLGWRAYSDAAGLAAPVFSVTSFAQQQESGVKCLDSGAAWLEAASTGASGPTMLIQDVAALLTPGGAYRLSAWMRADAAATASPVTAFLYATEAGITPADGVAAEIRLPAGAVPGEWTFCQSEEFVYAMPAGCTQAWVALAFTGSAGTTWWDRVSLVRVKPSG